MGLTSKEIVVLIINLLVGFGVAYLFVTYDFSPSNFKLTRELLTMSSVIFIVIVALIVVFGKKFNELTEQLNHQELEFKKLGEKLKIHEQLLDMRSDINYLKKEILKDG